MDRLKQLFAKFFQPTVDHAIADFRKALDKLNAVEKLHTELGDVQHQIALEAIAAREKFYAEADKARALVKKFEDFLHV